MKIFKNGISAVGKAVLGCAVLAACAAFTSCDEDSGDIGSTVMDSSVKIYVDSTFTAEAQSVPNSTVISRSLLQMLGRLDAENYGTMTTDYVTQMMAADNIDTTCVYVSNIDSLMLVLTAVKGSFIGDSVAPLGFKVYELTKPLPANVNSSFDPTGYYDASKPLAADAYNACLGDSADQSLTMYTYTAKLPRELGVRLFEAYKANPSNFATPQAFVKNVFNGLYIANSFGSGRITGLGGTMMRLFYHDTYYDSDKGKDTTVVKVGNYFASAAEVISNNNISYKPSANIKSMLEKKTNLIVAPAGYDVKIKLPVDKAIEKYKNNKGKYSLISSFKLSIPSEPIENALKIEPPTYLLLVRADKKDEFFSQNKLPDSKTSFYATYDSTTRKYDFGDLKAYLEELLADGEDIKPEDCEFVLCAVNIEFDEQQSYYGSYKVEKSVLPYAGVPVMVKLNVDKATIVFTFSTQGK